MKTLFVPMQHNRNDLLILVFLLKYFRTSLLENNRRYESFESGRRKESFDRKKERKQIRNNTQE